MIGTLNAMWQFIRAVMERMDKIHMSLIAAGVAFYAMFAVFPGIAALIALWGLWFDPAIIQEYERYIDEFVPLQAAQLLHAQIDAVTAGGRTQLGWASAISFIIATISARAGVDALVRGLNAAHGVRSHSTIFGFVLAYLLTLAIVGVVLMGLATIIIVPLAFNVMPPSPLRSWLIGMVPWTAMGLIVIIGIGILYRYGPNVKTPRNAIFTWGGLFATVAWGAASYGFSAYLASFNSYNRIYGSIGAVVALLMWFYLAGFSILLGALINVELGRSKRLRQARKARELAARMVREKAAQAGA